MQRDILVILEEAGGETAGTVTATLKAPDQIEFDREVDGLIALGLVRKEQSTIWEGETELVLTDAGAESLRK